MNIALDLDVFIMLTFVTRFLSLIFVVLISVYIFVVGNDAERIFEYRGQNECKINEIMKMGGWRFEKLFGDET